MYSLIWNKVELNVMSIEWCQHVAQTTVIHSFSRYLFLTPANVSFYLSVSIPVFYYIFTGCWHTFTSFYHFIKLQQ